MKYIFCVILVFLFGFHSIGQDRTYVHKTVGRLASPAFHGRGYFKGGDHKAARFLAREMKKAGLLPLWDQYSQEYSFDVNTFPGNIHIKIDKNRLSPGKDFVLHPAQSAIHERYELIWLPDSITKTESVYLLIDTTDLAAKMVVIPEHLSRAYRDGLPGVPALLHPEPDNLWWHVSTTQFEPGQVRLKVTSSKLPPDSRFIFIQAEPQLHHQRISNNIGGYVKGTHQPDSLILFVAHYDHIGRMGPKALFAGASDNASGTASVLDLARYYIRHPEKAYYTMVFLLVSGEEAGLLGSSHFVEYPPFSLDNIKFVTNLDMVGTGSEGITIVNGKAIPQAFDLFDQLNQTYDFLPHIYARGRTCNSDHCPFDRMGVPAVFIYTMGKENRQYHNIYDTPNRLPFTKYEQLFGLLTHFVDNLSNIPRFTILTDE